MNAATPDKTRIDSWLPWLIIGSAWLILYGPMMTGQTVTGFRDSAYLYFPLFAAMNQVWAAGEIPLWNPYCDFGFPTGADGSSSLFYPGKILFGLPVLSFPARYGLYLGAHALLAAIGTYRCARMLGCQRSGATIAAVSFAFGGPLLVQTSNVIYLVSGAWLPWALMYVWLLVHDGDWRAGCKAGGICALMVLGGDPQMVYHVGLIAAVSVLVVSIREWASANRDTKRERGNRFGIRLAGLVGMVVVATVLSAVQLIPTAELAARSERSAPGKVVNLYGAISQVWSSAPDADPDAILSPGDASVLDPLFLQSDQIVGQYQFSLPPWSWVELVIPNFSGRAFPVNQRWGDQLLAADRMWFPSLYMGLLVAVMAIGGLRFWGRHDRQVWLSWIFLVFLLGSSGWYGTTWFFREATAWPGAADPESLAGDTTRWASPVGGVYWWMSTLLPKYYVFRYPAKLFMVASLAISLLAGIGWGQHASSFGRKTWLSVMALLVFVGLIAASIGWGWFPPGSVFPVASPDDLSLFGPLDAAGAVRGLLVSLIQAMVVISLAFVVGVKPLGPRSVPARGWLLVALASIDLLLANRWLLAEIPAARMTVESDLQTSLSAIRSIDPLRSVVLVRNDDLPGRFSRSSENRLQEIVAWQQQSCQPKQHLVQSVRVIGSFHSIWPERYLDYVTWFRESSLGRSGVPCLATDTSITIDRASIYGCMEFDRGQWRWRSLPEDSETGNIESSSRRASYRLEITETDMDWNRARFQVRSQPPATADASESTWFELPLWGDSHWQVEVRDRRTRQPVTVKFRVSENDLLQIRLPSQGEYEVDLRYRPRWLIAGLSISGCGWLLGLAGLVAFRSRRSAD